MDGPKSRRTLDFVRSMFAPPNTYFFKCSPMKSWGLEVSSSATLSFKRFYQVWQGWKAMTHSRIGHYFFSYLLTCEVNLFEVLNIMAQMWQYSIIFVSHKATKVTSGFILNYLKKIIGGPTTQKNLKTNTKTIISSIWMRLQGPQGCQKMRHHPLNKLMEVWCAKIEPKLKKIQKSVRKQAYSTIFFSVLTGFLKFLQFWLNSSAKTQKF